MTSEFLLVSAPSACAALIMTHFCMKWAADNYELESEESVAVPVSLVFYQTVSSAWCLFCLFICMFQLWCICPGFSSPFVGYNWVVGLKISVWYRRLLLWNDVSGQKGLEFHLFQLCSLLGHIWLCQGGKKGILSTLEAKGREQEESESFVRTSGRRCWHLFPLTWVLSTEDMHAGWLRTIRFHFLFSCYSQDSSTLDVLYLHDLGLSLPLCTWKYVAPDYVGGTWKYMCTYHMSYIVILELHRNKQILYIICHRSLCWSDAEIYLRSSAQRKN